LTSDTPSLSTKPVSFVELSCHVTWICDPLIALTARFDGAAGSGGVVVAA
jgi:hypothetical protein